MQKVAIGWEIYERTGSAMALGYAGLVQFAPQALFMLFAGHVTDRHNRKHVLMTALAFNALAAACLALNAAVGGSIYVLYACLFAYGTARAFIMPSRAAFLPGIIPMDRFSTAVSWNSSGFEISSMAGPAIGGLLIGLSHSPMFVYSINALAQLTFVILLAGIPYKFLPGPRQPLSLESFSAGFRFVWKQKVVLSAMALDMFGVLLGGATALMTDLRKGHPAGRSQRPGLADDGAGHWGVFNGVVASPSRPVPSRGQDSAAGGRGIRACDDHLRHLAQFLALHGDALPARLIRQHQCRRAFDSGSDAYAGRDAWPCVGFEFAFHRDIQ